MVVDHQIHGQKRHDHRRNRLDHGRCSQSQGHLASGQSRIQCVRPFGSPIPKTRSGPPHLDRPKQYEWPQSTTMLSSLPGAPLGPRASGRLRRVRGFSGHWLPVGNEGHQGGSSNAQRDPPRGEAASRRCAALFLSFMKTPFKVAKFGSLLGHLCRRPRRTLPDDLTARLKPRHSSCL